MNESVVFGILMLNLLYSNAKFNLRKTKKQTDKLKQIYNAARELEENKKKEKDYTEHLVKSTLIGFIIIVSIVIMIIRFKTNYLVSFYLVRLYLIAVFGYISYLYIIIFQYMSFSFQESRNLIICKIIIKFCKKYDYSLPSSIAFDDLVIAHKNKLNDLDSEKAKERETVSVLKTNFSKDILIEIKNYFCLTKENQEREFNRFSELFTVVLASIIALSIISLSPNLQKYFENNNFNGIFGSSLFIFLIIPIVKFSITSVPPRVEIYNKCISLLDRAIN